MVDMVEVMGTGSGSDKSTDANVCVFEGRQPRIQQIDKIEKYWNKVRGNRLVPSRCEIDPRGMDGLLGHAFILERIAGGLARFRIAGSHLTDISGLELRQIPLSALFLPNSRELLSETLQAVFDCPAVVRMAISSPAGFGRAALKGELILLPLRSDLGDIDRILGGIVFEGNVGRRPRRIEIVSQARTSLVGYAGPLPGTEKPALEPVPSDSGQRNIDRKIANATSKVSHLRLVVCND